MLAVKTAHKFKCPYPQGRLSEPHVDTSQQPLIALAYTSCASFTPTSHLLFACLCFIYSRFPPLVRMPVFHSRPLSISCLHACVSFTPTSHLFFLRSFFLRSFVNHTRLPQKRVASPPLARLPVLARPVFHSCPLSTSCSHACVSFMPAFRLLFACLCFIHARFPPLVRMPVFHSRPLSTSFSLDRFKIVLQPHAAASQQVCQLHLLFACLCWHVLCCLFVRVLIHGRFSLFMNLIKGTSSHLSAALGQTLLARCSISICPWSLLNENFPSLVTSCRSFVSRV